MEWKEPCFDNKLTSSWNKSKSFGGSYGYTIIALGQTDSLKGRNLNDTSLIHQWVF